MFSIHMISRSLYITKMQIKHWDLSHALRTLMTCSVCRFLPIFKSVACDYPRRNLKWNASDFIEKMKQSPEYLKMKQSSRSTSFFFQDGTPFVSASELILKRSWRAHLDTINSVQKIIEPPALLTASFDRLVKV
jgi:hypothetical protein